MRVIFLMDPVEKLDLKDDSTLLLLAECLKRGHETFYGEPRDLFLEGEGLFGRFRSGLPSLEAAQEKGVLDSALPLATADAVFMRKDPPFNLAYVQALQMLTLLPPDVVVVNSPTGILRASEKLVSLQFADLMPRTLVTRDIARLRTFLASEGGSMIVKPLGGARGRGVMLLRDSDRNLSSLLELATDGGEHRVVAQQYVEEAREYDKRIMLLEGEPIGVSRRILSESELRPYTGKGARIARADLTERDREICRRIGPFLRREGLFLVGVDILGSYLSEINLTSPGCLVEINWLEKRSLEVGVIDRLEGLIKPRRWSPERSIVREPGAVLAC